MNTIQLQLVNNKNYPLNVTLFKGVSYVCVPPMDCVDVEDTGGVGYDFLLTDLLTNYILIHKIKVSFPNKPNQARFYFRERFLSPLGIGAARNISVSSVITAQQATDTIAEIDLKRPIKIGHNKRFLDYTVDANTTVLIVLSFKYETDKKDKEYRNFVENAESERQMQDILFNYNANSMKGIV